MERRTGDALADVRMDLAAVHASVDGLTRAIDGLASKAEVRAVESRQNRKRWTWVALLLIPGAAVATVAAVAFQQSERSAATLSNVEEVVEDLEELARERRSDVHEHRVRNELLHDCIADLLIDIVTAIQTPDGLAGTPITNTCPEPLDNEG